MNPVRPTTNSSRRRLGLAVWSLLVAFMALEIPNVTSGISLGIMLLISTLSASSRFLIEENPVKTDWNRHIPSIVAFLIPLAWSMILCDARTPTMCTLLVLIALGPVCISFLLNPLQPARQLKSSFATLPSDEKTNRIEQPSKEKEAALIEELHEEKETLSTVHFAKMTPPSARDTQDNSETLLPDVTQWLTRSQTAEGEIIKGGFRIEFADGQRDATVHLSFCPPFSNIPKILTENLDGENLEIHVAASFPFGARLTVRRSALSNKGEVSNSVKSCRIGFVAVAAPIRRAA